MSSIEVTRFAREDLAQLIETRRLPNDTRERVSRSLLALQEFPRAGKRLSGVSTPPSRSPRSPDPTASKSWATRRSRNRSLAAPKSPGIGLDKRDLPD
jgi:hypothetical protein